ncbi:MAG: hypothetical protein WBZ36_09360, partial [Candidatus Nitrosopolaris sp.]
CERLETLSNLFKLFDFVDRITTSWLLGPEIFVLLVIPRVNTCNTSISTIYWHNNILSAVRAALDSEVDSSTMFAR